MPVRLALLEDDPEQRLALKQVFTADTSYRLEAEFSGLDEFRQALPQLDVEVVLVDIQLPKGSGLEALQLLRKCEPRPKAIVLTAVNDSATLLAALQAGADGYLLKRGDPKGLLMRLGELLAGEVPMSPGIARRLLEHFRRSPGDPLAVATLSPAERDVLALLASGRSNKEIAEARGVGVPAVRSQITAIYRKLRVETRTEAVALFARHG
jgi:DNA-binding NarL/FixJ family response regulator